MPPRPETELERSPVIKRSVQISGHQTSIALEDPFWDALLEIAEEKKQTVNELISWLDIHRKRANLSSHLRLFVLNHYRQAIEARRKAVA
jgi:predicted DNA-binding ribbon-helix-helix protein